MASGRHIGLAVFLASAAGLGACGRNDDAIAQGLKMVDSACAKPSLDFRCVAAVNKVIPVLLENGKLNASSKEVYIPGVVKVQHEKSKSEIVCSTEISTTGIVGVDITIQSSAASACLQNIQRESGDSVVDAAAKEMNKKMTNHTKESLRLGG